MASFSVSKKYHFRRADYSKPTNSVTPWILRWMIWIDYLHNGEAMASSMAPSSHEMLYLKNKMKKLIPDAGFEKEHGAHVITFKTDGDEALFIFYAGTGKFDR